MTGAAATVSGFRAGFRALVRGGGLIVRTPRLWPYAIAPMLVATAAFALGFWAGCSLVSGYLDEGLAAWTGWFWGTLRAGIALVAYLAAGLAAAVAAKVVVLPVAAGPFAEMLSERVEAEMTGREGDARPFLESLRDALPAARRGLTTALYGILVLAAFLPVLLIPAVGALIYLAPTAYIEALGALDLVFGRRRMELAEKRAWMAERRAAVLGFGAAILVGNLIPLGALVVAPAAAAGGTLLIVQEKPT